MTTPESNGFDRVNDVFQNLDHQLADLRERLDDGRKRASEEIRRRTEGVEKEFRRASEEIETRLRESSTFQRVEKAVRQTRGDIEEELSRQRSRILGAFGLASKADLERLDRKIGKISRKLNSLVRQQDGASTDSPPQD